MVLILLIFICLQSGSAATADGGEPDLSLLVGEETRFYQVPQSCLEDLGTKLLTELKPLTDLREDIIAKANDFVEATSDLWNAQKGFWDCKRMLHQVDAMVQCFDQNFHPAKQNCEAARALNLTRLLMKSCYKISYEISTNRNGIHAFEADLIHLDDWQDCRQIVQKLMEDMSKTKVCEPFGDKRVFFTPKYEADGLVIKYKFSKNGVCSPLEFVACLLKGVVFLPIPLPCEEMHAQCTEGAFFGSLSRFEYQLKSVTLMLRNLSLLDLHFQPLVDNKRASEAFCEELFGPMSDAHSPRDYAKVLATGFYTIFVQGSFIGWEHEHAISAVKINTEFRIRDLFVHKAFLDGIVKPLCVTEEAALMDKCGSVCEEQKRILFKGWYEEAISWVQNIKPYKYVCFVQKANNDVLFTVTIPEKGL